jgi:hypothetical protein
MMEWFKEHESLLWVAGISSLVVVVASAVAIPALVVRMPPDYFAHARRPKGRLASSHPALRGLIIVGKNAVGAVLMVAGLAMLLLPGQGLLTALVGFFLIDAPGKYRVEKWLVRRSLVRRPIDWMRRKRGREPLKL